MGYVGNQQTEGFSQVPAKQDLTGATGTSLTLTHAVASAEGIDLFINNVRQEPTTAYSVGADGVTVTLTGSVVATDDIYVVYNSLARQTSTHPSNQALQATSGTFSGDLTVDTNTLYVDSTNNRVGIGTSSPSGFSGYTSLDINNATNGAIIDLSQGDSMKGRLIATTSTMAIETSSGVPIIFQPSGTERLRIDASGRVTMPYQPMSSHSTAVGSTADQVLPASSVQVNNGGHLSTSTNSGRFTAPVTGYYKCIFTGYTNYSNGYGYVNLRKNGAQQGYSIHWNHSGYQIHGGVSLNQVVYCSANDYLAFHSFGGSSWIQGGTVTFELIA